MKSFIPLFLILFSTFLYSQTRYYTFSELKGMEDQSGNTNLFYRMYYKLVETYNDVTENSIYHLDLNNNTDSLFLSEGSWGNPWISTAQFIADYKFWNNNPEKYIYIKIGCGIDCDGDIVRYDGTQLNFGIELPTHIGISGQNDSLVFIGTSSQRSFISKDGGKSDIKLNDSVSFYSLNPYDDKIVFGNYKGNLAKSTDGGVTFIPLNYSLNTQSNYVMLYDKDKLHIYLLNYKGLLVSSDTGSMWEEKYLLPSHQYNISPYISIDKSISGSIYIAFGENIFHSTDYGNSFSLYKILDHDIVGIYKKPKSNKLYAATKYKLVEINGDSVKVLKRLSLNPEVFSYFPLSVGDKWIYNERVTIIPEGDILYRDRVISVIGDTVISNGNSYKIISDNEKRRFLRLDSTGIVYEYFPYVYSDSVSKETIYQDLSMDVGDTIHSYWGGYNGRITFLYQDSVNTLGNRIVNKNYLFYSTTYQSWYQLAEGIGINIMRYGQDFELVDDTLKGAVINGIVYGDTTVTGIREKQNAPAKFVLYQNYPNPFNPSTTIRYNIPTSPPTPLLGKERGVVTLKVYDVLGRVVSTLVNKIQGPGNYKVEWNAKGFASGIYFYQIKAGNFIANKKMLLMK